MMSNTSSRICACSTLMRKVLIGAKSHEGCCILIRNRNRFAPAGAFESHLSRAKWMTEHGYRHLLRRGLKAVLMRNPGLACLSGRKCLSVEVHFASLGGVQRHV